MVQILERLTAALADRYRVERELGAGGMATVYLADDLRHARRVAVKVLRPELAAVLGPERFLQEIRLTAQLQHPHILPLYDSGNADGLLFYVMPYVEGESLRQRLDRQRQLPVDVAIELAAQVASALDYAHRRGVLHRDIKPENILLQEHQGLVADFGIALALQVAAGDRLTQTGLSLGTPGYMSPEQATGGSELSGQIDIYSLGCVVYEMLAGVPPFTGPTAQVVIARVVTDKPAPVTSLRPTVPTQVADAISRALEKVPADRFATGLDFARELKSPDSMTTRAAVPSADGRATRRVHRWLALLGWITAAALALRGRRPIEPAPPRSHHLSVVLPDSAQMALGGSDHETTGSGSLAISPDGGTVVYVARTANGTILYRRDLGVPGTEAIAGTEGAIHAFFSPDGRWIGYLTTNALVKVARVGGLPVPLTSIPPGSSGGYWGVQDTIIVAAADRGLIAVPAAGGEGTSLPAWSLPGGIFPDGLPGSEWVLLSTGYRVLGAVSRRDGRDLILTLRGLLPIDSADTGELIWGSYLRYSASGHLLYLAGNRLMALPFDYQSLRATGAPVPVLDRVRRENYAAAGQYSVSGEGTIVYGPGDDGTLGRLVWADRTGRVLDTLPIPASDFMSFELHPNGRYVASLTRPATGGSALSVTDLTRDTHEPIGLERWYQSALTWGPDSDSGLLVGAPLSGAWVTVISRPHSTGPIDTVLAGWSVFMPAGGDGRYGIATCRKAGDQCRAQDSLGRWLYSFESRRLDRRLTESNEQIIGTSADARWIYFRSSNGLYAAPLTNPNERNKVAPAAEPRLAPDGREIVYRVGRTWFSVTLHEEGGRISGNQPVALFTGTFGDLPSASFAVARDGRLLLLAQPTLRTMGSFDVITNFYAVLNRLAPPKRD